MFKLSHINTRAAFFCIIAWLGLGLGCRQGVDLYNLRADQVNWSTYTNSRLGYSVSYPAVLQLEEFGDGSVLFRNGMDGVPILVRFADEQEGKKRDLWFGHEPVEKINLAGRDGNKFIYSHHDGPFSTRTVSYVVAHQEKYLAVEFRASGELNEIQRRVLDSFKFSD